MMHRVSSSAPDTSGLVKRAARRGALLGTLLVGLALFGFALLHPGSSAAQTAGPTPTPVPPTATPAPPTATLAPPTATLPPATAVPSLTPGGPTATPAPSDTATPPSAGPTNTPPSTGATDTPTPPPVPTTLPPATSTAGPGPQISIKKTADPSTVPTGSTITFTIIVSNPGASDAHNVVLTDPVPDVFQVLKVTTTKGDATIAGQLVTVNIGTLSPGELVTITIVAAVKAVAVGGQTVTNTAMVVSVETGQSTSSADALITKPLLPPSGAGFEGGFLALATLVALALGLGGLALLRRRAPAGR